MSKAQPNWTKTLMNSFSCSVQCSCHIFILFAHFKYFPCTFLIFIYLHVAFLHVTNASFFTFIKVQDAEIHCVDMRILSTVSCSYHFPIHLSHALRTKQFHCGMQGRGFVLKLFMATSIQSTIQFSMKR